MINYRLVLKDFGKKTLEIRTGKVDGSGKIVFEVDGNRPPVRFIEISWEGDGNNSNNEPGVNQT